VDPWSELVALAERELELARAGRWDAVAESSTERVRRAAALGAAPASAAPALTRLAQLQAQITPLLLAARAFTARELASLRRGRHAVRGYGATASIVPARRRVDGLV
jgi:Flagellar protein FliT